jgi:uncharacterized protein
MNITAIIEVTENCNLNCTFCLRPSFKKFSMSTKILEKIISHLINNSKNRIDFIWHGGEPLILGIDFFKNVIKFQKKHNKKGIIIKNNVQTNGLLLNNKLIKFFENNSFAIGTSIQGTKEIHDSSRIDKGGKPTYDRLISKISMLKEKPSSIMVLTKETLGKEEKIYTEAKKYVKGIKISEYFPGGLNPGKNKTINKKDPIMPSPKEYGKSMIKFYEIWKKDVNPIEIKPITDIIKSFVIGKSGGCLYSQEVCNLSIIGVKSNGDFYTCIRGYPNKKFLIGNINEEPLKKLKKRGLSDLKKRETCLTKGECKNCEFWQYCNGGCPQESIKIYGNLNHKAFYCEGRKMLFKKILKDLKNDKF